MWVFMKQSLCLGAWWPEGRSSSSVFQSLPSYSWSACQMAVNRKDGYRGGLSRGMKGEWWAPTSKRLWACQIYNRDHESPPTALNSILTHYIYCDFSHHPSYINAVIRSGVFHLSGDVASGEGYWIFTMVGLQRWIENMLAPSFVKKHCFGMCRKLRITNHANTIHALVFFNYRQLVS